MARLIRVGETVTRGERKTLEYLQKHLPDDWVVIGNLQVSNGDRIREIDAVVIGSRGVWVVDEKGMGGTISGDEHVWILSSGHARERVMDSIEMAAKALKGKLTALRSDLPQNLWVESLVILSADDVDYKRLADPRKNDHIRKLSGCETYFLQAPTRGSGLTAKQRDAVVECLAGGRIANRLRRRFSEIGQYTLVERLREEPLGVTYLAHHSESREEVELKVYDLSALPTGVSRGSVLRRAQREFEALRQLRDQRGVIRVVESFQEVPGFGDDLFYIALDIPKGATLASRLADPEWKLDERLEFVQQLIELIAGIHRHGIIHRNLSPANVFFNSDGSLRLTGFELARVDVLGSIHLSQEDNQAGPYTPPELVELERPITAATDLYALGVMIYETLSGKRPFGNRTRNANDADPTISFVSGELSPAALSHIEAVLQLMLAYQPDDRFQSGEQIIDVALKPETTQFVLAKRAINAGHPLPTGAPLGELCVLDYLGSGGCFHAYLVESPMSGQKFVAKVLRFPELLLMNVVKQEFNALCAVHHPNIVEVFEARHRADAPYHILLQFVEGKSLSEIKANGPMDARTVAHWGYELADALLQLESCSPPIAHGDISPNNIIISEGKPCLIDFGLAHIGGQGVSDRITGTLNYRPPERDVPGAPWPEGGDTYSLAVILCELVFGEIPFLIDTSGYPHKERIREEFFVERPGISQELLRVLRRAISPDTTHRYLNSVSFKKALELTPELSNVGQLKIADPATAIPTTLVDFLSLPTHEAFVVMATMLSERHTLDTYRQDQLAWYTEEKQMRVWEAIEAKKQGRYSTSIEIYGEIFRENPTWHGLYNSIYKVLMPSGRIKEALTAIQIYGFLIGLNYACRNDALVHDRKFILETPYHALMLWPMQDRDAFLIHLGAATLASRNGMDSDMFTRYVNTIAGRDAILGVEADPDFIEHGKRALFELPWGVFSAFDTEGSLIHDLIQKVRSDFKLNGTEIAVEPGEDDPIDFRDALTQHLLKNSSMPESHGAKLGLIEMVEINHQPTDIEEQQLIDMENKLSELLVFRQQRPSQKYRGFKCHLDAMMFSLNGETRKALAKWQEGAKFGSKTSMFMAGVTLYDRLNRVQEAIHLWQQAAGLRHISAKYMLVFATHENGRQFPNATSAFKHHEKTKNNQNPSKWVALSLAYSYGLGVQYDDHIAVRLLQRAAEAGLADAQYMLAEAYLEGDGVPCNGETAVRWLEKAVSQSHLEAACKLGEILCNKGISNRSQDTEAARRGIELLTLAARGGDTDAQYWLGFEYEYGMAAEKDLEQSQMWYKKAAENGSYEALKALYHLRFPSTTPPQKTNVITEVDF